MYMSSSGNMRRRFLRPVPKAECRKVLEAKRRRSAAQRYVGLGMSLGTALGLAIGAGFGVALGNLAFGIGLGLAFGVATGAFLGNKYATAPPESSHTDGRH